MVSAKVSLSREEDRIEVCDEVLELGRDGDGGEKVFGWQKEAS